MKKKTQNMLIKIMSILSLFSFTAIVYLFYPMVKTLIDFDERMILALFPFFLILIVIYGLIFVMIKESFFKK